MIFDAVEKIPFGMKKNIIELFMKVYELDSQKDLKINGFDLDDFLKKEFYDNDHILIYEINKKAVGCLFLNNYEYINVTFYEKGCMQISNLYVIEEYRHQGVATALLRKAEEIARKSEIKTITSEYFVDNNESANWHSKNGFKIIKTNISVIKEI